MALTKTHNRMIDGASVNVKDFGATGDGTTDDSTAIASAISHADTIGGATVFFPEGIYNVGSTGISLTSSKVNLLGVGSGNEEASPSTAATVIKGTSTSDEVIKVGTSSAPLFRISISNLSVDTVASMTVPAIKVFADRCSFKNLHVDGGDSCILLAGGISNYFENCTLRDAETQCLFIDGQVSGGTNNNMFVNMDCRGAGSYGIKVKTNAGFAARDNTFMNCIMQANVTALYEDAIRSRHFSSHFEGNSTLNGVEYGASATESMFIGGNTFAETGTRPASTMIVHSGVIGGANIDASSNGSLEVLSDGDLRLFFDTDDNGDQLEIYKAGSTTATADLLLHLVGTSILMDAVTDVNLAGVAQILRATALGVEDRATDPSNPSAGRMVLWQSDGTGSGDDGDIMVKITDSLGTTKTTTLIDFSALP